MHLRVDGVSLGDQLKTLVEVWRHEERGSVDSRVALVGAVALVLADEVRLLVDD